MTRSNVIGIAYGFVCILFLSGCLGFVFREIPLVPLDFSIGEARSQSWPRPTASLPSHVSAHTGFTQQQQ